MTSRTASRVPWHPGDEKDAETKIDELVEAVRRFAKTR
jgi:hypothetical protein